VFGLDKMCDGGIEQGAVISENVYRSHRWAVSTAIRGWDSNAGGFCCALDAEALASKGMRRWRCVGAQSSKGCFDPDEQ
jgi:hypothetical protein